MEVEFRKKVFNEDLFECFLEIFNLVDTLYASPQNPEIADPSALLRKTVLEAFTTSDSISALHSYIKTLNLTNTSPFKQELPAFFEGYQLSKTHGDEVYDAFRMTLRHLTDLPGFPAWSLYFRSFSSLAEHAPDVNMDFLMTTRHLCAEGGSFTDWEAFFNTVVRLSGTPGDVIAGFLTTVRHLLDEREFSHWEEFFTTSVKLIGSSGNTQRDFFMTVRHLQDKPEFHMWSEFFQTSVKLTGVAEAVQTDFLMTIRHLQGISSFVLWEDFFKTTVSLMESGDAVLSDYAMTVRHLSLPQFHFTSWEEFFKGVLVLSNKPTHLIPFFTTVRHSLNYFKKPATMASILKNLSTFAPLHAFEAYSYGQLESKRWLVDELTDVLGKNWGTVFVLAGWIGSLSQLIFDSADIQVTKIRSFDLDETACKLGDKLNNVQVLENWKYKSVCMDISLMEYPTTYMVRRHDGTVLDLYDEPNVVINTSCEHIEDLQGWWNKIPVGTTVVLQNNNAFQIKDHINCVKSLEEFKKQLPLSQIRYAGELELSDYTRYMLIGQK